MPLAEPVEAVAADEIVGVARERSFEPRAGLRDAFAFAEAEFLARAGMRHDLAREHRDPRVLGPAIHFHAKLSAEIDELHARREESETAGGGRHVDPGLAMLPRHLPWRYDVKLRRT